MYGGKNCVKQPGLTCDIRCERLGGMDECGCCGGWLLAAAAVEPGLPREGGARGRDEAGREARDGTVGRDEAAAAAHPAGLPDQELEDVVDDVAGAGAPLGEVVLVQKAECLAWKKG